MTFAPWSTASTIPDAMVRESPDPVASITRIGRMLTSLASPATPAPSRDAAMIPATWVPCPVGSPVHGSSTKSIWGRTRPARSGWVASTPESTTATVTPPPRVTVQAPSACTADNPHWSTPNGSAPSAYTDEVR